MRPSLELLRTFLAVHRSGSITGGAEQLGLSQPTVTTQLKTLETALNRPLFDRLARGVRPTGAGDELARRVADPIDALDGLMLDELEAPTSATVHLGGPSDFLCTLVLPSLADRLADGLQLRATFGLPDDLLDRLANHSLDLVISSTRPRRAGVRATPFYDETFALVATPHWSAGTPTSSPEPLRNIPLIAYAEEAPIIRRYWRTVFNTRLTRTADLVVPDLRGVLAAVIAGAGASVLPTYLCERHLAAGELVALSDPELPPLNTLYLATRSNTGPHNPATVVRDQLLRTFTV
ncbi:LysR family transcriptional regulator [Kribbella sindirgiensis]|uniref:LysR family transcriptional regulator n=1 Tax=Kribbella sindirgiensis TaxID=1124744 RepID=A0A4R0I857_9ACTN|nr:LysR family transcriptional regulator [Kribbella sindirgiensis]TCC28379.1 LysR family transcriptional regulator [Kribbella sindirgiensis]